MSNLNITSKKQRTYDAIVIGSGASGGWAAKELCDAGLKTLVLERGKNIRHIEDYHAASKAPYDFEFRGRLPLEKGNGLVYGINPGSRLEESNIQWAMAEDEQPVVQEKPFKWRRSYHVGGKSLLWARQTQRWSDYDFEGPDRDGFAVDWPIRYKDIAPWYDHVEKFAGISGDKDGLDVLPDGEFLPSIELNVVEKHFKQVLQKEYGGSRHLIYARCAHLTDPQEIHIQQGRAKCVHQTLCNRGCIFGGYFSSNSSTIPWALKTGNLTMRPDAVVESVIYDQEKRKATGVRIIDRLTKEPIEFYADIVFVNASTINSNAILLNSTSDRFPNGLGNDNELMGKFLTWHNYRGHAGASVPGFSHKKVEGNRPTNAYIPRFRNVKKQETDFLRGYAIGVSAGRGTNYSTDMIGEELTESILNPKLSNDWYISTWMMGECVPVEDNHMRLHKDLRDKYGIPQIVLSAEWKENDIKQADDYVEQCKEMFEKAGFENIRASNRDTTPGSEIHEMGGVRMGKDPKTSLLNKWNQLHECKNVFVTDGASMTSGGSQNPTLHFMALTARAANHAVKELKKGNL
ncbi:MAG: GMC family oxidoreductase [Balneolaceae bacterium]|nr:GMC family oxidoreductase [Balneolaceae bacterium]MBO6546857.1 GMC family oxidoreductase [Balneolaceae bacterium]MBO6649217.1 GMC family oxidoreductase [Balneolaceae bacterium]